MPKIKTKFHFFLYANYDESFSYGEMVRVASYNPKVLIF
jgi:hypothetical protein